MDQNQQNPELPVDTTALAVETNNNYSPRGDSIFGDSPPRVTSEGGERADTPQHDNVLGDLPPLAATGGNEIPDAPVPDAPEDDSFLVREGSQIGEQTTEQNAGQGSQMVPLPAEYGTIDLDFDNMDVDNDDIDFAFQAEKLEQLLNPSTPNNPLGVLDQNDPTFSGSGFTANNNSGIPNQNPQATPLQQPGPSGTYNPNNPLNVPNQNAPAASIPEFEFSNPVPADFQPPNPTSGFRFPAPTDFLPIQSMINDQGNREGQFVNPANIYYNPNNGSAPQNPIAPYNQFLPAPNDTAYPTAPAPIPPPVNNQLPPPQNDIDPFAQSPSGVRGDAVSAPGQVVVPASQELGQHHRDAWFNPPDRTIETKRRQRQRADEQNPLYEKLKIPLTFSGRQKCRTCAVFPKNSHVYRKCNWTIDVDRQLQFACSNCTIWGLLCVVGDIILPPRPQTPVHSAPSFKFCDPCRNEGTNCDRGLPCDACHRIRKNPDGCVRTPAGRTATRGLIPRETAVGMELYPFLSAARGGPRGMDDPDVFGQVYDHAPDLHIQYLDWLKGAPIPLPVGYDRNYQRNLRIPPPILDIQLRTLPLPLPPKDFDEEKGSGGSKAVEGERRRRELARVGERSIVIPPVDEFGIRGQLLGTTVFNASQNLQRPPSPGPTLALFDLRDAADLSLEAQLPPDHPEHANITLICVPPPEHPNPTSLPALRTIPYHVPPQTGQPAAYSCLERRSHIPCSKLCSKVCVDLSHDPPLPVCADCDDRSKEAFGQAISLISLSLRAYACSFCTVVAAQDLNVYRGKRFTVWGLPLNAFTPSSKGKSPEDPEPSRSMGQPLPVTGCSCYTKIFDRTLCTPHRLEHFLDLRFKVESMREYVLMRRGRMLCPFCQSRAGADSHGFRDYNGDACTDICYVCMGCSGIVLLKPQVHSTEFCPPAVDNALELVKNYVHSMLD